MVGSDLVAQETRTGPTRPVPSNDNADLAGTSGAGKDTAQTKPDRIVLDIARMIGRHAASGRRTWPSCALFCHACRVRPPQIPIPHHCGNGQSNGAVSPRAASTGSTSCARRQPIVPWSCGNGAQQASARPQPPDGSLQAPERTISRTGRAGTPSVRAAETSIIEPVLPLGGRIHSPIRTRTRRWLPERVEIIVRAARRPRRPPWTGPQPKLADQTAPKTFN